MSYAWIVTSGLLFSLGVSDLSLECILGKICLLISAAFTLTLIPRSGWPGRSLVAVRDRRSALLFFLVLGLVEHLMVRQTGWFNHRIVAVSAASLLGGLGVGVVVRLFVVCLTLSNDTRATPIAALIISSGGVFGGLIHRWKPILAEHPLTGFYLATSVSFLRDIWMAFYPPQGISLPSSGDLFLAPILQGLGTALTLALVARIRKQDDQIRAVAWAEVGTLHARQTARYVCDALNSLAKLAAVESQKVPHSLGQLGCYLRASFDQHDQPLVRLAEELSVVSAYLEIESLRLSGQLELVQNVDPRLLQALIPSLSLQCLVENIVEHSHGIEPVVCRVHIKISSKQDWLEISVNHTDTCIAVTPSVFLPKRSEVDRLTLLRCQLRWLFGESFTLEVRNEVGAGQTVTLNVPLQMCPTVFHERTPGTSNSLTWERPNMRSHD